MQRIGILSLGLVLSAGCANAYKASYVTGSVTKELTTQAYDQYSLEFNKQLIECDPATNGEVTTKGEFDECMTPPFAKEAHDKIVKAIDVYYEAAKALSAILASENPGEDELRAAASAIFKSAITVLEMFPEAEKLVTKLKTLTGRK